MARTLVLALALVIPATVAEGQMHCPIGPNEVCVITTNTNTTDTTYNYATYAWNNAALTVRSETIGTDCGTTATNGWTIIIKDEAGTAGAHPIVVTPSAGSNDTIDGQGQFTLNSNFESITLQCDGTSNWLVE